MKKLICALLGLFVSVSAFADGITSHGIDAGYNKVSSSELWVPRYFFTNLKPAGPLTQDAIDAMIAKYDELAATEDVVGKASIGNEYFIYQDGTEPLTVTDLNEICLAGGIKQKSDCGTYVVNPIRAFLGRIPFHNVCLGAITGGTQHCVDNVFTTEYDVRMRGEWHNARQEIAEGIEPHINFHSSDLVTDMANDRYRYDRTVTRESDKSYAQDVKVAEWTAFGFAIEYARLHGHSVVCNSTVQNDFINCTTPDNKHFYTFKFASAHEDKLNNHGIERGICALFETGYHRLPNRYEHPYCDLNCSDGTTAGKIIPKFSVGRVFAYNIDSSKVCVLDNMENYMYKDDIKTYPDYEYMSYSFSEIQTVLDVQLVKTLRKYVEAQGIDVESFDCEYDAQRLAERYESVPVSTDEILRCTLNGKPVDFVFDDLYEGKEWAKEIGKSGMKCMLLPRYGGGTASFDGKFCTGPDKNQCTELGKKVAGGTSWDEEAGKCVLNDAAAVKKIQTIAVVVGGTVFVAGVTVLSGGTLGVVFLEAGAGLAADVLINALERIEETMDHQAAKDLVTKLRNCSISLKREEQGVCSAAQKSCVQDVMADGLALAMEFSDNLSDEDLKGIDDLMEYTEPCWDLTVVKNAIEMEPDHAAILQGKHKWVNLGITVAALGTVFFNPRSALAKVGKYKRLEKIFEKAGAKLIKTQNVTVLRGGKTVTVNRIDLGGVYGDKAVEDILKQLEKRGIRYVDYSKVQNLNKDSFKALLNRSDRAAFDALTNQDEVLKAVNEELATMQNYIDFSNKWHGGLPDIGITVDKLGYKATIMANASEKAAFMQRVRSAGMTWIMLNAADEAGTAGWSLLFGNKSNNGNNSGTNPNNPGTNPGEPSDGETTNSGGDDGVGRVVQFDIDTVDGQLKARPVNSGNEAVEDNTQSGQVGDDGDHLIDDIDEMIRRSGGQ